MQPQHHVIPVIPGVLVDTWSTPCQAGLFIHSPWWAFCCSSVHNPLLFLLASPLASRCCLWARQSGFALHVALSGTRTAGKSRHSICTSYPVLETKSPEAERLGTITLWFLWSGTWASWLSDPCSWSLRRWLHLQSLEG